MSRLMGFAAKKHKDTEVSKKVVLFGWKTLRLNPENHVNPVKINFRAKPAHDHRRAVYVLILASASPLLAKESERIYMLFLKVFSTLRKKLFSRFNKKKSSDEEVEGAG